MSYNPNNPNGQATMANSAPVVIASNQTAIPITDNSGSITVDGTITANAGTNLNTSALALESGGNLATTATNTTGLNNTVGTAASAIPTKVLMAGGSDGTNARALSVTTAGLAKVDLSGSAANSTAGLISTKIDQTTVGTTNGVSLAQVGATTVATGNGVVGAGVQRVAIASDNTAFSVNATNVDITATGNITTQNLVPAGTATANSAVLSGSLAGISSAAVQVTGTYTGALTLQGTVDNSTWVSVGGTPFYNVNTNAYSATIASAATGIFQISTNGYKQIRITGLSAMTGTATVSIQLTNGASNIGQSLPAGTAIIGALSANQSTNIAQINGVTPLMGNGVTGTGSPRVTLASDGTAISTTGYMSVKVDQTTQGTTNGVVPLAATTGGYSISYAVSAASNNKTQAKGSAGQVYFVSIENISSAPVYLKMFDNTSAGVTAGTTAATYQFMCPANATAANGAGLVLSFPNGITHSTGITWMLTTGISSTDNTSTSANIAIVTIGYK